MGVRAAPLNHLDLWHLSYRCGRLIAIMRAEAAGQPDTVDGMLDGGHGPTPLSDTQVLLRSLTRPPETVTPQDQLRRYLVEHGLRPGDRLPSEGDLGDALGCSRVVVREALRGLQAVGLLEARAGSGWYVRNFDISTATRTVAQSLAFHPAVLLDLLFVRRSIEADLLVELAGKLSEADLAALEELADRMRWRAGRGERFHAEDGAFHRCVVAASANLIALSLTDLHWGLMEALYEQGLPGPAPTDLPGVADAHAEIAAALRRGDGQQAARMLRASHDEAEHRYRSWLDRATDPTGAREQALRDAVKSALLWPGRRRGL